MGLVVGGRTDFMETLQAQARAERAVQGVAPVRARAPFEPWHTVGASGQPAYLAGWAAYPGWSGAQFARTADNILHFRGRIAFDFAGTSNRSMFTLPAGYAGYAQLATYCVVTRLVGSPAEMNPYLPAAAAATMIHIDVLSIATVSVASPATGRSYYADAGWVVLGSLRSRISV